MGSHTATVLTLPNGHGCGGNANGVATTYYLLDQPYGTYVLDTKEMSEFDPKPINKAVDRYNIEIPLLRYV